MIVAVVVGTHLRTSISAGLIHTAKPLCVACNPGLPCCTTSSPTGAAMISSSPASFFEVALRGFEGIIGPYGLGLEGRVVCLFCGG